MKSTLNTNRLILRPLIRSDATRFSKLASNPKVASMTGSFPCPFPVCSVEGLIDIFAARRVTGQAFHWAVDRGDGDLIGVIGLDRHEDRYELGYWLGEPFWGQGFGTEMIAAILAEHERVRPGKTVSASVFADNPASARLLKRAGFIRIESGCSGYSLARASHAPLHRYEYRSARSAAKTKSTETAAPVPA